MTIHGVDLIAKERSRQINEKGYSRSGDKGNADVLTNFAVNKMRKAFDILMVDEGNDEKAIEHLKKAGALCAAAIDAIQLEKKDE